MIFSRFDCAFWFIVLILILLLGAQRTCVYDFRMLVPNKMQHVICTGNVGNEQYAELRELAPNLHVVAGDFDAGNSGSLGQNVSFPETRVVQVGDFQIGVIHGHQIIPWNDHSALARMRRKLNVDILISGHSHQNQVLEHEGYHHINPVCLFRLRNICVLLLLQTCPSFAL